MPYADSDFLLALLKPSDWLKRPAEKVLRKHRGRIWTSVITLAETMMVGKAYGLDPEKLISDINDVVTVNANDLKVALRAAVLMNRKRMNTFDAFHAAFAMDDMVITSDAVFETAGLKIISLRDQVRR